MTRKLQRLGAQNRSHLSTYTVAMWLVYMDFVSTDHQNMSPEMSGHHLQEVTDVVRDALSQRVKQWEESLYSRRQPKHKNVLAPASPLFVKGNHSVTQVIWSPTRYCSSHKHF